MKLAAVLAVAATFAIPAAAANPPRVVLGIDARTIELGTRLAWFDPAHARDPAGPEGVLARSAIRHLERSRPDRSKLALGG